MSDLVFYTNPMSRGRIVRWMLEEVGVSYQTKVLDYAEVKAPEFLTINPMGKMPTIVHGTTVVTEAAAICAYLADAFPAAGLAPPPNDRGAYYRWLFFAAGPLEAAMTNQALGVAVPPERRRMAGYGCMEDVLQTIETALAEREYCAGDAFSAADVYLGSGLGFGLMFGSIERRPVFERYVGALQARPAAVRAREIDDALIAAAKA
ncbi:Glutathione S-transferase [Beijerinckiaceae bacterium RH AL1]|nr:glutathione S-transferase family protein [Beijerinckiaceae bacterium]VVB42910.1 Glutathione S-transferase [Beijerinckiaceae bacterium RH AL8]VVB42921.1 Glutathione S-transferase [Beijerinckiaceae bacterium RH CH11]VVC53569.1 Glutathione S-transferase [Beijerinckiaceae bacterium RH AL1]